MFSKKVTFVRNKFLYYILSELFNIAKSIKINLLIFEYIIAKQINKDI